MFSQRRPQLYPICWYNNVTLLLFLLLERWGLYYLSLDLDRHIIKEVSHQKVIQFSPGSSGRLSSSLEPGTMLWGSPRSFHESPQNTYRWFSQPSQLTSLPTANIILQTYEGLNLQMLSGPSHLINLQLLNLLSWGSRHFGIKISLLCYPLSKFLTNRIIDNNKIVILFATMFDLL